MKKLHNKLLQHSRHYRKWHEHPYHRHHHWLVAILALLIGSYAIAGAWQVTLHEQELLSITLLVPSARAQSSCTHTVAQDGSGNFRTIQAAVDAAQPGWVVCVKPGEYQERVVMKSSGQAGKLITLQGTRGTGGEWPTIIDGGTFASGWVPAPEVGTGVYKTTSLGFNPQSMTVDNKMLARINDVYMASGEGFDYLRKPPDATVIAGYTGVTIKFWDVLEALYGYRNGTTYLRFRNGDDPNTKGVRMSPGGAVVTIDDRSYIVMRGFMIRNGQDGVVISGTGAANNLIEENYIMHGHNRVVIRSGAAYNQVRNNEITMNFYGLRDPGAWYEGATYTSGLRDYLYEFYKYGVGTGSSDDRGVEIDEPGAGNEIAGNHIFQGLIGVRVYRARNLKVHDNIIHNHSSIGLLPLEGSVDAEYYDNLLYDNNINLRIHQLEVPEQRREYFYRNRSYQPKELPGVEHIFFHYDSQTPPVGYSQPELYFYHNSFSGGGPAMTISIYSLGFGGLPKAYFLNNVFSTGRLVAAVDEIYGDKNKIGVFDYNWAGGGYKGGVLPAWPGSYNIAAEDQRMWDDSQMPDFLLPANSPARDAGIDLSKPFTIDGKNFPAFPGMTIGYVGADGKPDMGATQSEQGGCTPSPEVCDGKDNDCDNQIDEENVCGTTNQPPRNLFLRYLGPTP